MEIENSRITLGGIFLAVASIPFDSYELSGLVSPADFAVLLLGILILLEVYRKGGVIKIGRRSLLLVFLVAVLVLGRAGPILAGYTDPISVQYVASGVTVLVFVAVVSLSCSREYRIRRVIVLLWAMTVILSLANILYAYGIMGAPEVFVRTPPTREVLAEPFGIQRRSTIIFQTFGAFATWGIVSAVFATISLRQDGWIPRPAAAFSLPLLLLNVVAVLQSRSGIIGLVGAFTVLGCLFLGRSRWGRRLLAIVTTIVGVAAVLIADLLINALIGLQPGSVSARLQQYTVALELFTTSPATGVGYGVVIEAVDHSIHNLFIEVLVFSGPIGALAFLILTVMLVRRLLGGIGEIENVAFLTALIGVYVVAMFYPSSSSFTVWLVIALASAYIDTDTTLTGDGGSSGVSTPMSTWESSSEDTR